jgi:hypothetical protein
MKWEGDKYIVARSVQMLKLDTRAELAAEIKFAACD